MQRTFFTLLVCSCFIGGCPGDAQDVAGGGGSGDGGDSAGGNAPFDRCKPGGEPEVIVGEGQGNYLSIDEGATLQVEAGPQGGYHVWIAARLKNLTASGSVTTVSGSFVDFDYEPPPISLVFSFDPDEGGYCKIYGLRFRIDDPEHPVEELLGEALDVTVTITDANGVVESDTKRIVLSSSFI